MNEKSLRGTAALNKVLQLDAITQRISPPETRKKNIIKKKQKFSYTKGEPNKVYSFN
jgi:hypothetical protein